ncbi:flavin-containing monooxygenase [Actinomadura sp. GTD37]|uniref:flavin-containing monooxygenase n=1 Tax=Actinomadura sp. GTD37 TaxID=1778030 RepID=UPI0035BF17C2
MSPPDRDVIVIGAGMGGVYAAHRLMGQGLSVLGIESAPEVGGVWYHNAYPGARVDLESHYYCYLFDDDLYREWKWSERYAAQPELLRYLKHFADRFDVRRHFRFGTSVVGARWDEDGRRWAVQTDAGDVVTARFLVSTTGQLSKSRDPGFPGLDTFRGRWVQTSHWPQDGVDLKGKKVGIVGTGSSGVQAATAIAAQAERLVVFQRTPNYSVPAHNGPADHELQAELAGDLATVRAKVAAAPAGNLTPAYAGRAADFSAKQRRDLLDERWAFGGQPLLALFTDQGTNLEANRIVGDYVRAKVREVVKDPEVADRVVPDAYPIGTRRLCVDTGYYEIFNQDNVTLVDVRSDPIRRITPGGIETKDASHDLDVIVFALGFEAFTGALDQAGVRNAAGELVSDGWQRGPETYLGLMTAGFPNLFLITGPGSPSVLANMNVHNVQHLDFVGDLIEHARERGADRIEPTRRAQSEWTAHAAEVAGPLIRRQVDNYMVHVNKDDGSRVFLPYGGGFHQYVRRCAEVATTGFRGFDMR